MTKEFRTSIEVSEPAVDTVQNWLNRYHQECIDKKRENMQVAAGILDALGPTGAQGLSLQYIQWSQIRRALDNAALNPQNGPLTVLTIATYILQLSAHQKKDAIGEIEKETRQNMPFSM
ncbi:MAG: hypothetical protein JWM56_172 [Candidatus Peribacteria bacterium]|nr:hypothetical protein [Candidatus Peribacteria bacterium]